jgi:hypothetical protein
MRISKRARTAFLIAAGRSASSRVRVHGTTFFSSPRLLSLVPRTQVTRILLMLLLPVLRLPVSAAAEGQNLGEFVDRTALRVCADPSNLPFSNERGEGFENRDAELMADKLGVPLAYTWYPNTVGFVR